MDGKVALGVRNSFSFPADTFTNDPLRKLSLPDPHLRRLRLVEQLERRGTGDCECTSGPSRCYVHLFFNTGEWTKLVQMND